MKNYNTLITSSTINEFQLEISNRNLTNNKIKKNFIIFAIIQLLFGLIFAIIIRIIAGYWMDGVYGMGSLFLIPYSILFLLSSLLTFKNKKISFFLLLLLSGWSTFFTVLLVFWQYSIFTLIFLLMYLIVSILSIYSIILTRKTYDNVVPDNFNTIQANIFIILNSKKKSAFYINDINNKWQFKKDGLLSKEYNLEDLIDYNLYENNIVIYSKGNSIGTAMIGGLLFGGSGAIAGAIAGNKKESLKTTKSYIFRITIDDLQNAGVEFLCENSEVAFKIISTMNLINSKK